MNEMYHCLRVVLCLSVFVAIYLATKAQGHNDKQRQFSTIAETSGVVLIFNTVFTINPFFENFLCFGSE